MKTIERLYDFNTKNMRAKVIKAFRPYALKPKEVGDRIYSQYFFQGLSRGLFSYSFDRRDASYKDWRDLQLRVQKSWQDNGHQYYGEVQPHNPYSGRGLVIDPQLEEEALYRIGEYIDIGNREAEWE